MSGKYEGNFSIRGATYDDDRAVIWLCKYYEPFNVIDTSPLKTRQKLWRECEKYFGKMLHCTWDKQSKRGVPLGTVYGTLVTNEEKENGTAGNIVREETGTRVDRAA